MPHRVLIRCGSACGNKCAAAGYGIPGSFDLQSGNPAGMVVPMYERTDAPVTAGFGEIPNGDQGTRVTLAAMRALARAGARDPGVRETAIRVIGAAGAQGHDPMTQITALFEFVRDRIMFIGDVHGVETLQSPAVTLRFGAGDCDDRATLLAALILSVGIPADLRFRVIAGNPSRPGEFSHVYVTVSMRGRRVALDPTYRSNAVGFQYPGATRMGEFAV